MPQPVLKASNITKSFNGVKVLHGLDFSLMPGEVVAIMGPSGSGKSTLLHCLASIIAIDSGQIYLQQELTSDYSDAKATKLRRQHYGFVFQFGQLVPELSALDNTALPLLLNGLSRQGSYQQAADMLKQVDLLDHQHKLPVDMSGGQMQRVAIARALVATPQVLFADEPTGSLDSFNSQKIMELFVELAKQKGVAIAMVTHEPTVAAYADREVLIKDGRVVQ